jgi:magnesium transporter
MRLLPPDDAADVIQEAPDTEREALLALLDEPTRHEVGALLAYAEDDAGRSHEPALRALRPEMSVDEAITLPPPPGPRALETIYYVYVLDAEQQLLGVVSFRELFSAPPDEDGARHHAARTSSRRRGDGPGGAQQLFAETDFLAIPVVDADAAREGHRHRRRHRRRRPGGGDRGHPEDRRHGGARRAVPRVGFWSMVRKRAGWLASSSSARC